MKWVASILGSVVALAVLGGLLWFVLNQVGAKKALARAQIQAGTASVAAGQAQAETAAQRIIVAGEAHDHLDIQVHQSNAQAIASAPGADRPLDPGLVGAVNRGLCRYQAFAADPGCAGLLETHPAELPDAGAGRGPPGPD
ncbi:MAG TPA: hypothetical protein VGH15_05815 [Caulobacteraceae bacterium]|jgi:hypothetical protein